MRITAAAIILMLPLLVFGREVRLEQYQSLYSFQQYAVNYQKLTKYHEPVLSSKQVRLYRTQLIDQAKQGPNFAGHIKVASWGCGTCCHQLAFINLINGNVWFPDFSVTCGYTPENTEEESWAFDITHTATENFKKDSNLLILYGTKNEAGCSAVYYFVWQSNALKEIKKDKEVCSESRT